MSSFSFDHKGLRWLDDPDVLCEGEDLEHVNRTDITETDKSIRALRTKGTFPQDVHGDLSGRIGYEESDPLNKRLPHRQSTAVIRPDGHADAVFLKKVFGQLRLRMICELRYH